MRLSPALRGAYASRLCTKRAGAFWRTGLRGEDGDSARLQLFLPVGLYLPAGATLTVDQGTTYRIPFTWCLTNTCIAGDLANPNLLRDMDAGQKLVLQVVDTNLLSVRTLLPLDRFATAHKGAAVRVFEQDIDE